MTGIEILYKGSENIGRCYTKTNYQIVSSRPIDQNMFNSLVDWGFISNGQGKSIVQIIDGKSHPVPEKITWNTKVAASITESFAKDGFTYYNKSYIYNIQIECDSGD